MPSALPNDEVRVKTVPNLLAQMVFFVVCAFLTALIPIMVLADGVKQGPVAVILPPWLSPAEQFALAAQTGAPLREVRAGFNLWVFNAPDQATMQRVAALPGLLLPAGLVGCGNVPLRPPPDRS
jgi:hypothetical protein